MAKKDSTNARTAAIEKARAEQRRKEIRNRVLAWGTVGLVVAGLTTAAAVTLSNAAADQAAIEEIASAPIEGATVTPDLTADHVPALPEPVASAAGTLLPPVGGEHDPVWLNCGVYDEQVPTYNAVHSLEHGAVWVAYAPGLAESEIATLREAVSPYAYTILSPFEELAAPIVLTAWGVQLEIEDADDERVAAFLARHVQGEGTPEPGASCSGGVGEPA